MRPPKGGAPSALATGTVTHQPSPSVPTGPGEVTFANRRYARSRCDTDHDAVRPRMGNSAPKSVVRQSLSFCCWHVHGFSYVATVSSLGLLSGDRLVRRPADSSPGWRRARMAVFRARGSWRLDLRVAGCFGQQILTTIAARPAPTQLPAGHAPGQSGRAAGPGNHRLARAFGSVCASLPFTAVHGRPRAACPRWSGMLAAGDGR